MVNAILHIEAREDGFDEHLDKPEMKRMLVELLVHQIMDKFEECLRDIGQGKPSKYFSLVDDRIGNDSNNSKRI